MKKIIKIEEELQIGNIILEKGDKIEILFERDMSIYYKDVVRIIQNIFDEAQERDKAENYVFLQGEVIAVSAEKENSMYFADYYNEFELGGYSGPFISSDFEKELKKRGLSVEWYDPGTLHIFK